MGIDHHQDADGRDDQQHHPGEGIDGGIERQSQPADPAKPGAVDLAAEHPSTDGDDPHQGAQRCDGGNEKHPPAEALAEQTDHCCDQGMTNQHDGHW